MNKNNKMETYIQAVAGSIRAFPQEARRIEADLRAHFSAALEAGETEQDVITRMGDPQEVALAFLSQVAFDYAGFWVRVVAFALDLLVIFLVAAPLAVLAMLLTHLVPPHPQGLGYLVGAIVILTTFGFGLGTLGTILLYFPILEGRFGATPGKRLFRLRVLKENGLPIGYKESFLRRLSYYFKMSPVDALFIPFNEKRQRAFDMVAHTIVIREG